MGMGASTLMKNLPTLEISAFSHPQSGRTLETIENHVLNSLGNLSRFFSNGIK
jgi:hypothetical protein